MIRKIPLAIILLISSSSLLSDVYDTHPIFGLMLTILIGWGIGYLVFERNISVLAYHIARAAFLFSFSLCAGVFLMTSFETGSAEVMASLFFALQLVGVYLFDWISEVWEWVS